MSKKQLKKALKHNKVDAILTHVKNRGTKDEVKYYDLYLVRS